MLEIIGLATIVLAVLIAGVLGYAATRPETFTVQRAMSIKAPPERISPLIDNLRDFARWSLLADRLAVLHEHGLVTRRAYQKSPERFEYRLAGKGADLLPVLQALARWGHEHIPNRWARPRWFVEATPEVFYPVD